MALIFIIAYNFKFLYPWIQFSAQACKSVFVMVYNDRYLIYTIPHAYKVNLENYDIYNFWYGLRCLLFTVIAAYSQYIRDCWDIFVNYKYCIHNNNNCQYCTAICLFPLILSVTTFFSILRFSFAYKEQFAPGFTTLHCF